MTNHLFWDITIYGNPQLIRLEHAGYNTNIDIPEGLARLQLHKQPKLDHGAKVLYDAFCLCDSARVFASQFCDFSAGLLAAAQLPTFVTFVSFAVRFCAFGGRKSVHVLFVLVDYKTT